MNAAERRKRQFKKNIFSLTVFSFVILVIWVGFEIFQATRAPKMDIDVSANQLKPIDRELYLELAERLAARETIPQDVLEGIVTPSPTPTPIVEIVDPTATPAAQPLSLPVGTQEPETQQNQAGEGSGFNLGNLDTN